MRAAAALFIFICSFFAAIDARAFHPFQQNFTNTTQVLDYAGALHQRTIDDLKVMTEDTEYFTARPLNLLTVPELKGWKPEMYAAVALRDMGLTDPARPGVLLFVSKKEMTGDIALGPGLDRWITPKTVRTIMQEEVFPNLAKGDIEAALKDGGWALSDAIQGKYKTKAQKLREFMPLLIIFPVLLLFYLFFGEGKAARLTDLLGGAWGRW